MVQPATRRRWEAFWEEHRRAWEKAHPPLRRRLPHSEDVVLDAIPFMSWHHTRWFSESGRIERLDWERTNGPDRVFERAEWPGDGDCEGLVFVAEKVEDHAASLDAYGAFTDRPPTTGRQAWKRGVYDRKHGRTWGGRGEYRYIVLTDYDYDAIRRDLWLDGYTRREADELARRDFKARVQRLEKLGRGDDCFVGVRVTVYADDELTDELGSSAIWGIESDAGEYFDQVAKDCAQEAVIEAKETLRRRVERYQTLLPILTT